MLHNGLFPCTITSMHINVSALGYMYKLNKVSAEAQKERGRHYVYVFDKR